MCLGRPDGKFHAWFYISTEGDPNKAKHNIISEEMMEANFLFEVHFRKYNVTVKHYHADNGHFADNKFMAE
eukprot:5860708-Ditylum_brightwellii.AAC.2